MQLHSLSSNKANLVEVEPGLITNIFFIKAFFLSHCKPSEKKRKDSYETNLSLEKKRIL